MPKANVPFFDESVDFTKPVDAGVTFLYMVAGAALLLGALGGGRWALKQFQTTTGVGESVSIPVAGD